MKIENIKAYMDIFKLVFMAVYASGVTIASFYFFFCLVFYKIPEDNQQYANLVLGFLIGSGMSTFLGYYFGMSQGQLSKTVDRPPAPPETPCLDPIKEDTK